jgi:hypothetical protein
MEITIYFFENKENTAPEHRWTADIPQLITLVNGATREEALKNARIEALESLAFYIGEGRITPEEASEIRFRESDELLSAKELAGLTPRWFQEAVREASSTEAHPIP